jgi:hypothetical protein
VTKSADLTQLKKKIRELLEKGKAQWRKSWPWF